MHATTTTDDIVADADPAARHDHRSQAAPCATCLSARRRLAAALVGLARPVG